MDRRVTERRALCMGEREQRADSMGWGFAVPVGWAGCLSQVCNLVTLRVVVSPEQGRGLARLSFLETRCSVLSR